MKKSVKEKQVLVLGANAKSSIPVIESCSRMGLYVIAASNKRFCCGFYSRYTDERLIYPSPNDKPEVFLEFIINFIKKRKIEMVFPLGHFLTDFIAKHQQRLREYTKMLLPSYEIFVQGLNKISTMKTADSIGCAIPKSWFPQQQSLESIAGEVTYPVLIKPAVSVGARGITYCYSKIELINKYHEIEQRYNDCFIQEFIPQNGVQYKCALLMGQNQKVYCGIVYEKLRYYPVNGGSSTLNKSVHRPDIMESSIKMAQKLKWTGPIDFDYITDPRDNIVKLMEINPRFSDTYKMTVVAGLDMTKSAYMLANGLEPAVQLDYKKDKYLRFLFGDIMWFLTAKKGRWTAKPSFFSIFRSDTTYLMTGTNDIGPVIGYILDNASLLFDKKAREFTLRLNNQR